MLLCVALTILERNIIRVYIYYKKKKEVSVLCDYCYKCRVVSLCRNKYM